MTVLDRSLDSFRVWLIEERGLGRQAASNALSRSRRVERLLNQVLDDFVRTEDGLSKAIERLRHDVSVPESSRSGLVRALRLYAQYASTYPGARERAAAHEAVLHAFREWMERDLGHTPIPERSQESRLRRVERVLDIGLPAVAATAGGLTD